MKKAKMTPEEYMEKYGETRDERLHRLRSRRWINGWYKGWEESGAFCGAGTLSAASDNALDYHTYAPSTSGYDMGYLMGMINRRGEYHNKMDEKELEDALRYAEADVEKLTAKVKKLEREKAELEKIHNI